MLYDEIDLAPGKVRVKQGGGTGGHNGIRSLEAHIGKDFWRVRLGVGHPGVKELVHGHVLSDFAKADKAWLEKLLDVVADEIPLLASGDAPRFMSRVAELTNPPRNKAAKKKPDESGDTPATLDPAKGLFAKLFSKSPPSKSD